MAIKFLNYNLVDQDSTTITASSENAFFTTANLKDPRTTKVFRSTTASVNIVFDFVTTEPVDTIALVPSFKDGFGHTGTITVEANATDSWSSPAFTTTITASEIDEAHGIGYKELSATQNYRFWRFVANGTGYVEFSNIIIGERLVIGDTTNPRSIEFGWKYEDRDNSNMKKNRYGQKFIDLVNRQRVFSGSFKNLSKDELADFFEMYDYNGTTKPLFVRIGDSGMIDDVDRFSGYVYMTKIPSITNKFYQRYDLSVAYEEAM